MERTEAIHQEIGQLPVPAAAELVEPRAETKGNTQESHTRRTQGRCSVTQRLERVRKAARQRKQEKFTALLHHIDFDLLLESFLALKRGAAAGVDKVTWEDYDIQVQENLQDLHKRIHSIAAHTGRYPSEGYSYLKLTADNARWE